MVLFLESNLHSLCLMNLGKAPFQRHPVYEGCHVGHTELGVGVMKGKLQGNAFAQS